jgi:hypothetical protein
MMLQSACPSRSRIAEERIGSGALTATLSIFGNVVAGACFELVPAPEIRVCVKRAKQALRPRSR